MIGLYGITGFKVSTNILVPLMDVKTDKLLTSYLFIKDKNSQKIYDDYIVLTYDKSVDDIENYTYKIYQKSYVYYLFSIDNQSDLFKDTYNKVVYRQNGHIYSKYSQIDKEAKKKILLYAERTKKNTNEKLIFLSELNKILYPSNAFELLANRLTTYNKAHYNDILREIKNIGEYGSSINVDAETTILDLSSINIDVIQEKIELNL